jgi:two-component system cell cycle sensor histidine kinase/response regulator CckA
VRVDNQEDFLTELDSGFDIILMDYRMPGWNLIAALGELQARKLDIPVIVVSGSLGEEEAIEALQEGAVDYVLKDRMRRLADAVTRALERKEVNRALKDSERRYRSMFEDNPNPMYVYDVETLKLLAVNDAAVTHYGYAKDEFLNLTIRDIRPLGEQDALSRSLAGADSLGSGLQSPGEFKHQKKDGTAIDVRIDWHPIMFMGRPARAVLATDITEQKRAALALGASEARKAAILESALDGIITIDANGLVLDFNPAAERMFGYTQTQASGRGLADLIIPADLRQAHRDGLARYTSTGPHVILNRRVETRGLRADGTEFPVELTIVPVRGRIAEPIFTGYLRDITERKESDAVLRGRDQALKESEERFRRIAETVTEVFWIADVATQRIIYVSPGYEQVWGRSCESLCLNPRSIVETIHPDDRQRVVDNLKRQGAGLPFEHEYRIVRPDGEVRWIWDRGFPIRDDGGRLVQYVGAAQDITDRKGAEQAFAESEERTRLALEASQVGIWETNLWTGVAYWSEICEAIHGLKPGAFGKTFDAFIACIHPDDRERATKAIETAIRDHAQGDLEYRTQWPDGTERLINTTTRFFYDDKGVPVRGTGVAIDVTDRRSLENQLRQAQKMEAVGQLAGGVAHDFNNLLTAILGFAELLTPLLGQDDQGLKDLEQIRKAATRATHLTKQLLAFSRRQIFEPVVLDLNAVISELGGLLRRLIREDIEIKVILNQGIGCVKADPGQIEQVMMNLAVNARDAMPKGGRLTIETASADLDRGFFKKHGIPDESAHRHFAVLIVSDSGVGMDQATKHRIFEPFFTTKPKGEGTGLGLATVYGIVKQSGGFLLVESEPGRGSTFKIYLPRTEENLVREAVASTGVRPVTGTETVLLVEDEEHVRMLARALLDRNGYHVIEAADAENAAGLAQRDDIDLLLTDVVMPGQSGPELFARLKPLHPRMRVLYVSGYADHAIARRGILEPGASFVQKPFTAAALMGKVRDVLDATDDRD